MCEFKKIAHEFVESILRIWNILSLLKRSVSNECFLIRCWFSRPFYDNYAWKGTLIYLKIQLKLKKSFIIFIRVPLATNTSKHGIYFHDRFLTVMLEKVIFKFLRTFSLKLYFHFISSYLLLRLIRQEKSLFRQISANSMMWN